MSAERHSETRAHKFAEVAAPAAPSGEHLSLEDLHNVRLSLTADLGRTVMSVRQVLDLREGSTVQLNKLAGEMTDIYVNGIPSARGEVVVIGDMLHIRIGEVIGAVLEEKEGGDEA
jgi:flagellar motor switch protein FliN